MTSESIPNTSSLTYLPEVIIIDNNWSATVATYDWCTGSGIEGDPYIIAGGTLGIINVFSERD